MRSYHLISVGSIVDHSSRNMETPRGGFQFISKPLFLFGDYASSVMHHVGNNCKPDGYTKCVSQTLSKIPRPTTLVLGSAPAGALGLRIALRKLRFKRDNKNTMVH